MTTLEKLAALPPVFRKGGSVTAGNSSGRNDGAAALLVMAEEKARRLGMKPRVRIVSAAASGCDPAIMGIGPVECTRVALERAGLTLKEIDVIELNEAFAAQSLAVIREWVKWGIDRESLMAKINPNGGAIAMGHPLGCTGAALTVKCLSELQRWSVPIRPHHDVLRRGAGRGDDRREMLTASEKARCGVALPPSSLRRTKLYASFLRSRAPCLRSFLRSRPDAELETYGEYRYRYTE